MTEHNRGGLAVGLGRLFGEGTLAGLDDGELLDRFVSRRDEGAFALLVERLGPMVLAVCRAILPGRQDAEDAFQASFLVLTKKAAAIRDRAAVGPWVYGVAHRVASRARVDAARRRAREGLAGRSVLTGSNGSEGAAVVARDEDSAAIHEELARLPEKYRRPVVLCDLQGQTHEEAARVLGCPIGTVKGRLSRARDLLRNRLVRRGITPSVVTATALAHSARASVPPELLNRTVSAALGVGGSVSPSIVSTAALTLANEVTLAMTFAKLKGLAAACLLATGTVAGASALLASPQEPAPIRDPGPAESAPSPDLEKTVDNPPEQDSDDARVPYPSGPTDPEPSLELLERDVPALTAEEQEIDARLGEGSAAVLRALEAKVEMPFAAETPLSEFVEYLKSVVTTPDFPGNIPVYVDPIGLREAEVTLESSIQIDLRTIPLRRTLHLALRPLGLAYTVMDGMVVISTPDQLDELLLATPVHQVSELARLEHKVNDGQAQDSEIKLYQKLIQAGQSGGGMGQSTSMEGGAMGGFQ